MKRGKRALIILALALAGCQAPRLSVTPAATTYTIHVGCTADTVPLVRELAAGFQGAHPELRLALRLTINPPETLMAAAQTPPPDPEANQALAQPTVAILPLLPSMSVAWAAPLAVDQLAIVVHPDNPVTGLTLADLRAIYAGRITDWAAVGGASTPITVLSREAGAATRVIFAQRLLGNTPVTRNARLLPSGAAIIDIVSQEPGAIGYVALSLVDARVRLLALDGTLPTLDTPHPPYPLPLYVVGPAEPTGILRAFIAWAQSDAGQAIVARRYLPLPE